MLLQVLQCGLRLLVKRRRLLDSDTRRHCITRINHPAPATGPTRRCERRAAFGWGSLRRWILFETRQLVLQFSNPRGGRLRRSVSLSVFHAKRGKAALELLHLRAQAVFAELWRRCSSGQRPLRNSSGLGCLLLGPRATAAPAPKLSKDGLRLLADGFVMGLVALAMRAMVSILRLDG
jgi:hypothetical protein